MILQGGPKYVPCWSLRGIPLDLTHLILGLMSPSVIGPLWNMQAPGVS